jgi:hypothetical protein
MAHGVVDERSVTKGSWAGWDGISTPENLRDGVCVWDIESYTHVYEAINDPARHYFALITPGSITPLTDGVLIETLAETSVGIGTLDTAHFFQETGLNLEAEEVLTHDLNSAGQSVRRVGGQVASFRTGPPGVPLQVSDTFAEVKIGPAGCSISMSDYTGQIEELSTTRSFGMEISTELGPVKLAFGIENETERSDSYEVGVGQATTFNVNIPGLSESYYDAGGSYKVKAFLDKVTLSSGLKLLRLGYWVPEDDRGRAFTDGHSPALTFTKISDTQDVEKDSPLKIEVTADDVLGIAQGTVWYRLVRTDTEQVLATGQLNHDEGIKYSASVAISGLEVGLQYGFEVGAKNNAIPPKEAVLSYKAPGDNKMVFTTEAGTLTLSIYRSWDGQPNNAKENVPVTFTKFCSEAVTCSWTFDDGTTATGESVTRSFCCGNHYVKLRADNTGHPARHGTVRDSFTVDDVPPTLSLEVPTDPLIAGQTYKFGVHFSDCAWDSMTVAWDFGDEATSTHTWDVVGSGSQLFGTWHTYSGTVIGSLTVKATVTESVGGQSRTDVVQATVQVRRNSAPSWGGGDPRGGEPAVF